MRIDLNADLGEGFGDWRMGEDEALLDLLSSANIACGFHAGDPVIMRHTVREAARRGVDIGAHVGYPDLQGFGRRPMQIDPRDLASMVVYQLGALAGIAKAEGQRVTHMSFHGALGNLVAADATLAHTLLAAVAAFDDRLIVSTSPSQAIEQAAATLGLAVTRTFLADRACDAQGLLIPRKLPDAVIHHADTVLARVRQLLETGSVRCYDGQTIAMRVDSILLHSDTQGALALAKGIRAEIQAHGGSVVPLSQRVHRQAQPT